MPPRRALEIVKKHAPVHLVVSDVVMPEMHGPQLIREVAQLSPGSPAVLMTGASMNEADLPADVPVLRKPLSIRDLLSAVEATLSKWPGLE